MDLIKLAGFQAVRITQIWSPGQTTLSPEDTAVIDNVVGAAQLDGIQVFASVLNATAKTTPLTAQDQADFAAYAASLVTAFPGITHLIVGNEPNLNLYWLPQFDVDGSDAAATAYEGLLATTYDAVKAVAPKVMVLGGAVSPRGNDQPNGTRLTHSPSTFIPDLGAAYRASGRTTPIMDGFAFHPYEDNSSIAPANGVNPKSTSVMIADYDKLVGLLSTAFDGTGQEGSTLPIYYDEFGVQSQIPPEEAALYTGAEQSTTKPVDELTQGAYYTQAIQIAFCSPTVAGFFVFHSVDETALTGWQSGLYYPDLAPKASLPAVQLAIRLARRGVVARCPGLVLTPKAKASQHGSRLVLTCDIDCSYIAQLYLLPRKILITRRGRIVGGKPTTLPIQAPTVFGRYRLRLTFWASINAGLPKVIQLPVTPR
jgi:Cellulase (glycosyl hydrolase family 5)